MKHDNLRKDLMAVEAEENLLIDFHFLLQETMSAKGISQSELADRAGISKARLSQLLSAEANPTVKTMARLFHAMDERICVSRWAAANAAPLLEVAKGGAWNWELSAVDVRTDDQLVAVVKKSSASNDNSVFFLDSELDLAPELEAAEAA